MQDTYILRQTSNKLVCFFSSSKNSIVYKTYENNKWSPIKNVLLDTLNYFTVTVSKSGVIYIFCQNLKGDIVLCTCDNALNNWSTKVLLKNESEKIHTILFYPIIKENQLCIVYNIPLDNGEFQLVSQSINDKGTWEVPTHIDNIVMSGKNIFEVQNVSNDHLIVFYKAKRLENNMGYREITASKYSDFNPIHLTSYQIVDSSFITTTDSIHAIYIVKSMFSYQILYRKKDLKIFSNPIVIYEGKKMSNCLLSIVNNTIHATFNCNGQMLISQSKNDGKSFTSPEVYKNKICANPKKSIYISESSMGTNEFFVREVYVDNHQPWDIQILPEIYEDFYPTTVYKEVEKIDSTSAASTNDSYSMQVALKNLEKQNKEKEDQIIYMANIINKYKSKKEDTDFEKVAIEKKYLKKIEILNAELINLKNLNKELSIRLEKATGLNKELGIKLNEKNINTQNKEKDTDNRVVTIQSNSPTVLIPYKR